MEEIITTHIIKDLQEQTVVLPAFSKIVHGFANGNTPCIFVQQPVVKEGMMEHKFHLVLVDTEVAFDSSYAMKYIATIRFQDKRTRHLFEDQNASGGSQRTFIKTTVS